MERNKPINKIERYFRKNWDGLLILAVVFGGGIACKVVSDFLSKLVRGDKSSATCPSQEPSPSLTPQATYTDRPTYTPYPTLTEPYCGPTPTRTPTLTATGTLIWEPTNEPPEETVVPPTRRPTRTPNEATPAPTNVDIPATATRKQ